MRLLIIGQLPPPYHGTAVAMEAVYKSPLINKFFSIEVINISRERLPSDDSIGRFSLKKFFHDLKSIIKFLRVVSSSDIVYISISQTPLGLMRDLIFISISEILKKPIVVHLHGGYFKFMLGRCKLIFKVLVTKILTKISAAIVLTPSLKKMFYGIIEDRKIHVVYNFVDEEYFLSENEVSEKIQEVIDGLELKVLYMSNMLKLKGYWDLLEAAKILKRKNLKISFTFAGVFPDVLEEKKFKEYVIKNDLMKIVKFIGYVKYNQKYNVLKSSHIFVLPTYYHEGLPISLLEAMSMGLAVITTRRGGIPDVVKENVNGLFVSAGSPDSIAKIIEKLYNRRELLADLISNNVKKAKKNFFRENYENKLLKILLKSLKEKSR